MVKNCSNCMWGDKCSTIGDCDYYDPLEETDFEICNAEQLEKQEWQNYLHYLHQEGN